MLVDVVVGCVTWKLFVSGEVVGEQRLVKGGVVDGCADVGKESVPGRWSEYCALEHLVC